LANRVLIFSKACNDKAVALKLPFKLYFAVGGTWDFNQLVPDRMLPVVTNANKVPGEWYWDIHVPSDLGADGDSQPGGARLTKRLGEIRAFLESVSSMKGVVFEENGGRHDMNRVLGHARASNRLQRQGDFIRIDTSANCLQGFGQNNDNWDQGNLFYTPEIVWVQPSGWSHRMIQDSYQPFTTPFTDSLAWNHTIDIVTVRNQNGSVFVIRAANFGNFDVDISFVLNGCTAASSSVKLVQIHGDLGTSNPPTDPNRLTPKSSTVTMTSMAAPATLRITLPYYSFSTLTFALKGARVDDVTTA